MKPDLRVLAASAISEQLALRALMLSQLAAVLSPFASRFSTVVTVVDVAYVAVFTTQFAPLCSPMTMKLTPSVAPVQVIIAPVPTAMTTNFPSQMTAVITTISAFLPMFRQRLGAHAHKQQRSDGECAYHAPECTDSESHFLPPQVLS
jgi:hypothetical protein